MQIVWIYEHPVDFDALKDFHGKIDYGLVGRRIERSPLPFGRHRWVSTGGRPPAIEFDDRVRPRAELSDWADERSQLPIDPEWGPGWHVGIARFEDGSTAISGVISHCLADGVGAIVAVLDAAHGNKRDFGYPLAHSRTRMRALATDAGQTARSVPELARALVGAAKLLSRHRHDIARPAAQRPTASFAGADCNIVVPSVSIYVDLEAWDARANALGGTSYSLFAGLAAKLGEHMGRRRAEDGAITLLIPITDRTLDDTRANAMNYVSANVDPTQVTTDLTDARAVVKQALETAQDAPNETAELLALIPFIPKRALIRAANVLFGFADFPVFCSNVGDIPPELGRPDGTDAEYIMLRAADQNVTRSYIESVGGQLVVAGGRLGGKMAISVVAYQPGRKNTKPELRELVTNTLAEFGLTGIVE